MRAERRAALWAFVLFFCLLSSYYVLRPLREAMGIVGNVKDLSRLFIATLAGTLILTPVVAALVSRFPRRRFVPVVYRFFALNLVVFYLLLRGEVSPTAARVFFVWTSVFNMFALSVFWGLLADLFRREQAQRLFGKIGVGGTLGAMAGSGLTAFLSERVGVAALCLVSAALLEIAVHCVQALVGVFGDSPDEKRDPELALGGVFAWLPELFKSPLLLAIVAYMLLFTFTSTAAYFEQARIVKVAIASNAARTALFAKMDLAVNVASLVLQGLVVAPLLRRLGVGLTLLLLPLLTIAGFAALRLSPTLAVLVIFQVGRRAADYGIAKPTREVVFTTIPREEKYKAKSFIDTFVYRAGDATAATFEGGLLAIPLCVVWAGVALFLGRRTNQMTIPSTR